MKRAVFGVFGAAASGFLLLLAMPLVGFWPVGWVALVPLFLACRGQRFIVGFGLGVVTAFTLAALTISGVFFADHDSTGEVTWIKLGCAIFGAVVGVVSAFLAEVRLGDSRRLIGLAAFAVLFEAATLRVLPVTLALTQPNVAGMRMVASLVGIWGVAFLLWLVNLFIAECLLRRDWRPLLPVAVGLPVTLLVGWSWSTRDGNRNRVPIVLVQSESEPPRLAAMSGHNPLALAVWPEFGGLSTAPGGNSKELREFSQRANAPAIVTSFRDDFRPLPHNVAALFFRGAESDRYAKRLLFGSEKQMHSAGDQAVSVPWQGTKVGLNICFDSCWPGLLRQTAMPGDVRLIVVPAIDPPSPYHWVAAMHAAFTPFRAAENGVSIARADGIAYSTVVDGSGNVLQTLLPGEASIQVPTPIGRRWTLYRLIGDLLLWIFGGLVLYALIPKKNRASSEPLSKGPLPPETGRTPPESPCPS
ncbi:nitrilase-related carbon-nitrogen hydrolase [Fimbriimonas ginsengisoli]|uniref:nitrilase-related carbon-nitrogen hydrolase n=1 Tax=Fimbriimonas ginsengisoli TaxID=1005039 RepID=UPI00046D21DC|nr:nitrilase-related carbon-nitrogen hydrolase [Fimbriimonas ginsengisoli]